MAQEKRKLTGRMFQLIEIVWTISIVSTATAVGAYLGWESYGLDGTLALGFVGLVAGAFLSSPLFLLQVIT